MFFVCHLHECMSHFDMGIFVKLMNIYMYIYIYTYIYIYVKHTYNYIITFLKDDRARNGPASFEHVEKWILSEFVNLTVSCAFAKDGRHFKML